MCMTPSTLITETYTELNFSQRFFHGAPQHRNLPKITTTGNLQKLSDQLATNKYPAHLDGLLNFGFHGTVFIFSNSDVQCEGVDDF